MATRRDANGDAVVINADKVQRWRLDLTAAETQFHRWLQGPGQEAYRAARDSAVRDVLGLLARTHDLRDLTTDTLRSSPATITPLRMCTAPPLARDRLVSLARSERPIITTMERDRLPARMSARELDAQLERICAVIQEFLDPDVFCWLGGGEDPTPAQREHAARLVADRQCDAAADRIMRHARQNHQRQLMRDWLNSRGYRERDQQPGQDLLDMATGSFFLGKVMVGADSRTQDVRLDGVIAPQRRGPTLLIKTVSEADVAKSDRPLKAAVCQRLRRIVPDSATLTLLLGGVVDPIYLRTLASQGLDWVWEHRIEDLEQAGA